MRTSIASSWKFGKCLRIVNWNFQNVLMWCQYEVCHIIISHVTEGIKILPKTVSVDHIRDMNMVLLHRLECIVALSFPRKHAIPLLQFKLHRTFDTSMKINLLHQPYNNEKTMMNKCDEIELKNHGLLLVLYIPTKIFLFLFVLLVFTSNFSVTLSQFFFIFFSFFGFFFIHSISHFPSVFFSIRHLPPWLFSSLTVILSVAHSLTFPFY